MNKKQSRKLKTVFGKKIENFTDDTLLDFLEKGHGYLEIDTVCGKFSLALSPGQARNALKWAVGVFQGRIKKGAIK